MATFPVKANWAPLDKLASADLDNIGGVLNLYNPTGKGSIFGASAAGVPSELLAGTNGQVLTADSTAAAGIKWAAAAATSIPANASATVATNEITTSTTFTNLTTAGPAVTVVTGTKALVTISFGVYGPNSGVGPSADMGFDISGATTLSASVTKSLSLQIVSAANLEQASATYLMTGLTAGSNTFTAKYKETGGQMSFVNRNISVIDMGS